MQQRVEILRALDRGARILVLDEPTAVLTAQETAELARSCAGCATAGPPSSSSPTSCTRSSRSPTASPCCGAARRVGTIDTAGADEASLARMMVGRDVVLRVEKERSSPASRCSRSSDLHVARRPRAARRRRRHAAGARGRDRRASPGSTATGRASSSRPIAGLRQIESGQIRVCGKAITGADPRHARRAGVGHIAEDRHRRGLVLDFDLTENLALRDYRTGSSWGLLSLRRMLEAAKRLIGEFDVRGGTPSTLARSLSGGNQQKVVIAREISGNPEALVAAQPTRGLDVGAIEFVHRRLLAERDAGKAILLVSLELEEVRNLADRILVDLRRAGSSASCRRARPTRSSGCS